MLLNWFIESYSKLIHLLQTPYKFRLSFTSLRTSRQVIFFLQHVLGGFFLVVHIPPCLCLFFWWSTSHTSHYELCDVVPAIRGPSSRSWTRSRSPWFGAFQSPSVRLRISSNCRPTDPDWHVWEVTRKFPGNALDPQIVWRIRSILGEQSFFLSSLDTISMTVLSMRTLKGLSYTCETAN